MNNKKILRLIVIIFCFYLIITTIKAIFDLWKAGDKLILRQKKVENLQKDQEALLRQKAAIDNPAYWEKVARDKIGLGKPGEEVIIIPQELLKDNAKIASDPAVPNWMRWIKLVI